MTTAEQVRVAVQHPLEPLTAEEIETASQILKQDRGLAESARFVYITLHEPDKEAVLRHQRGDAFDREAHIVLRERAECRTYEAVVSVTAGEVRLWRELPDVQPAVIGRADGVDDRVVVRKQIVVAEVLANLDVEEELEFAATRDPVE